MLLYCLPEWRTAFVKPALIAALIVLPAIGVTLLQNKQVTGSWTTLPYSLSQYQYGVPASLTFQPRPVPHRELTREQDLDYKMQRGFRSTETDTLAHLLRAAAVPHAILPVLFLRAAVSGPARVSGNHAHLAGRVGRLTALLFALGVNFFPEFQFHYMAAVVCLFVLMSVTGLRRISEWRGGGAAARVLIYLCVAQFVFWYGVHLLDRHDFAAAMERYDTWDSINHRNPARRIEMNRQLAAMPGNCWFLFATGRSTFFRTSGFTTPRTSMAPAWCGRAIWATPKTRNCGSIIRTARRCCWNRMRILRA